MSAALAEVNADVAEITSAASELNTAVSEINADVSEVNAAVSESSADVSVVNSAPSEVRSPVAQSKLRAGAFQFTAICSWFLLAEFDLMTFINWNPGTKVI